VDPLRTFHLYSLTILSKWTFNICTPNLEIGRSQWAYLSRFMFSICATIRLGDYFLSSSKSSIGNFFLLYLRGIERTIPSYFDLWGFGNVTWRIWRLLALHFLTKLRKRLGKIWIAYANLYGNSHVWEKALKWSQLKMHFFFLIRVISEIASYCSYVRSITAQRWWRLFFRRFVSDCELLRIFTLQLFEKAGRTYLWETLNHWSVCIQLSNLRGKSTPLSRIN
jgi:hypothetical protein